MWLKIPKTVSTVLMVLHIMKYKRFYSNLENTVMHMTHTAIRFLYAIAQ
jgi:hypothetical protein